MAHTGRKAIVCYYCDLGHPYAPLMERMTASARDTQPDSVLILLTPTPETECRRYFDDVCPIKKPTSEKNLCRERARATASWMMQDHVPPTIFADPDIVFRKPIEFGDHFDIGLLWRDKKPDQPVNTGLVLAQNRRPAFWHHYGEIAINLPEVLWWWFADQLAYSLLTGVCRKPGDLFMVDDARVELLDMAKVCPVTEHETPDAWAIHAKGRRKGDGWEKLFKGHEETA